MASFKKGFTLIELVLIIVIVGILASITLPKFVNFKTKAILKQEDYVIGALISAVQTKAMQNLSQGSEPDNAMTGSPDQPTKGQEYRYIFLGSLNAFGQVRFAGDIYKGYNYGH